MAIKKKIDLLIISMSFPYPLVAGGKIRIYNLIKQLSHSCNISLISLITKREIPYIHEIEKFCEKVYTIQIHEETGERLIHHIRSLSRMFKGMPAEMALKFYPEFYGTLKKILKERSFDIVQIEFVQMVPYVLEDNVVEGNYIWVEHEVLYHRLQKRGEAGKGFWRWFWKREAKLTRIYEQMAANKFKNAVAVSEEEASCLRSWNPELNVAVIPNGVDVSYYDEIEVVRDPMSVIFAGWMKHFPNLDAARFLVNDIIPYVIRRRPDIKFYLVGGPYPPEIKSMAQKIHQIKLTGFVNDIRPMVKQAGVYIVPLRVGGGTHLKVLEGMASRTPIVTTPVGAEGLPVKHKEHVWIAHDAEGLAEGILKVIEDRELNITLQENARKLVESKFDWKIIGQQQLQFYHNVLGSFEF